mmetsp:Transcript_102363/g.325260  ORF Transcript_102363/g.325260 Transcript_102363/m.325260 type:complete len:422 (-) Transcript_102363:209-1474(-)
MGGSCAGSSSAGIGRFWLINCWRLVRGTSRLRWPFPRGTLLCCPSTVGQLPPRRPVPVLGGGGGGALGFPPSRACAGCGAGGGGGGRVRATGMGSPGGISLPKAEPTRRLGGGGGATGAPGNPPSVGGVCTSDGSGPVPRPSDMGAMKLPMPPPHPRWIVMFNNWPCFANSLAIRDESQQPMPLTCRMKSPGCIRNTGRCWRFHSAIKPTSATRLIMRPQVPPEINKTSRPKRTPGRFFTFTSKEKTGSRGLGGGCGVPGVPSRRGAMMNESSLSSFISVWGFRPESWPPGTPHLPGPGGAAGAWRLTPKFGLFGVRGPSCPPPGPSGRGSPLMKPPVSAPPPPVAPLSTFVARFHTAATSAPPPWMSWWAIASRGRGGSSPRRIVMRISCPVHSSSIMAIAGASAVTLLTQMMRSPSRML